jgi:hypothetical protein
VRRRLEQQRGLADAGLAAQQHERDRARCRPPSTRSNSSMPLDNRSACAASTSLYSFAELALPSCA